MWDVILGGITGLIGSVATAVTNYKIQKLKNEHDRARWDFEKEMVKAETEAMIEEAKMNIKITEAQTEAAVELADTEAYVRNIEKGNVDKFSDKYVNALFGVQGKLRYVAIPVGILVSFLFGIVDFLKALMRPGLTMYLVGCSTWITIMAWDILEKAGIDQLTAAQATGIFNDVTTTIIYLTVSCVTWWFGDRRIAKFLMRLKDGNIKNTD